MADADNATRAPESDAQEAVEVPDATSTSAPAPNEQPTASHGQHTGEHCVTDRPTRESQDMELGSSCELWSVEPNG